MPDIRKIAIKPHSASLVRNNQGSDGKTVNYFLEEKYRKRRSVRNGEL